MGICCIAHEEDLCCEVRNRLRQLINEILHIEFSSTKYVYHRQSSNTTIRQKVISDIRRKTSSSIMYNNIRIDMFRRNLIDTTTILNNTLQGELPSITRIRQNIRLHSLQPLQSSRYFSCIMEYIIRKLQRNILEFPLDE